MHELMRLDGVSDGDLYGSGSGSRTLVRALLADGLVENGVAYLAYRPQA